MKYKHRGNFIALSGIFVAAAVAAVSFFTWDFLESSEQPAKPRIVYGASGTAFASARPARGESVVNVEYASPKGENKALAAQDAPAPVVETPLARPQTPKQEPAAAPVRAASDKKSGVPEQITSSSEKGLWIFIDKAEQKLYLVDGRKIINKWGVSTGKVPGNKRKVGDMRTPEGNFTVQQIQDARAWTHDFKDGEGVIKDAYGDWFIRLKTPPHTGIGIHGTHKPQIIGTPDSEGCIRLKNEDLRELKKHVKIGMKVVIGPDAVSLSEAKSEPKTIAPAKADKAEVKKAPRPSAQNKKPQKAAVKSSSKKNRKK